VYSTVSPSPPEEVSLQALCHAHFPGAGDSIIQSLRFNPAYCFQNLYQNRLDGPVTCHILVLNLGFLIFQALCHSHFPGAGDPMIQSLREREFFIHNLLVRIHFIIVMIRWTGLAPWEFPGAGDSIIQSLRFTGVPRSKETAPPQDPTVGLCLGTYGGPRGGGAFL